MCTGAEIIPLVASTALSAGGAMIADQEAQDRQDAIAAARNAELDDHLRRQDRLAQQGQALFDERQQRMNEEQQQQLREKQLAELKEVLAPGDTTPVQDIVASAAPKRVQSELAARLAKAGEEAKRNSDTLADLRSYDEQWFNNGLQSHELGRRLQTINAHAAANQRMLPTQQDLAGASVNKPVSPLGGVLKTAGSVGAQAAGSGYF